MNASRISEASGRHFIDASKFASAAASMPVDRLSSPFALRASASHFSAGGFCVVVVLPLLVVVVLFGLVFGPSGLATCSGLQRKLPIRPSVPSRPDLDTRR